MVIIPTKIRKIPCSFELILKLEMYFIQVANGEFTELGWSNPSFIRSREAHPTAADSETNAESRDDACPSILLWECPSGTASIVSQFHI